MSKLLTFTYFLHTQEGDQSPPIRAVRRTGTNNHPKKPIRTPGRHFSGPRSVLEAHPPWRFPSTLGSWTSTRRNRKENRGLGAPGAAGAGAARPGSPGAGSGHRWLQAADCGCKYRMIRTGRIEKQGDLPLGREISSRSAG